MSSFKVRVVTGCSQSDFDLDNLFNKIFDQSEEKNLECKKHILINKLKVFIGDFFVDLVFENEDSKKLKFLRKSFLESSCKDIIDISEIYFYN